MKNQIKNRIEKRYKELNNIKEYINKNYGHTGHFYAEGRKAEIENEIYFLQNLIIKET